LLNPCAMSAVTQSFASYSCRGICYKTQGQIVHCKNISGDDVKFCCVLMTFPWHETPLRSSGKLSPPLGTYNQYKEDQSADCWQHASAQAADSVTMLRGDQAEVVSHYKYLGSL